MIYTLTEDLRDWLLENNRPGGGESMHAAMLRREAEAKDKKAAAAAAEATEAEVSAENHLDHCLRLPRFLRLPAVRPLTDWPRQ